jgi:hypothetical protein
VTPRILTIAVIRLPPNIDHLLEFLRVHPELACLGDERSDVLLAEVVSAAFQQLGTRARSDEHPDTPSLVKDPVGHKLVHALRSGGRVDPVKGSQLVGRWHPGLLGERAVDDRALDLLGDLEKQRAPVVLHDDRGLSQFFGLWSCRPRGLPTGEVAYSTVASSLRRWL